MRSPDSATDAGRGQTFVFADLAGFTALTEAHGDADAARFVDEFALAARGLLGGLDAEVVKPIGDALMIRASTAEAAIAAAVRIRDDIGSRHGFPAVRIGMHTGPALHRGSDWYGAAVNLAARVAAEASAGEILATEATRSAAGRPAGVVFADRGRRSLKNVAQPVQLHAIARAARTHDYRLEIDPVCRMAVDPAHSAGSLREGGVVYWFCSLACAQAFAADPGPFVPAVHRSAARGLRGIALAQGSSYLAFGLWSLLARRHYRRIHRLSGDDWLLNAHGMWLVVIGGTLARAAWRREVVSTAADGLGLAAALGLAADDLWSSRSPGLARIYRADLAWEAALAAGWLVGRRRGGRSWPAGRSPLRRSRTTGRERGPGGPRQ